MVFFAKLAAAQFSNDIPAANWLKGIFFTESDSIVNLEGWIS